MLKSSGHRNVTVKRKSNHQVVVESIRAPCSLRTSRSVILLGGRSEQMTVVPLDRSSSFLLVIPAGLAWKRWETQVRTTGINRIAGKLYNQSDTRREGVDKHCWNSPSTRSTRSVKSSLRLRRPWVPRRRHRNRIPRPCPRRANLGNYDNVDIVCAVLHAALEIRTFLHIPDSDATFA